MWYINFFKRLSQDSISEIKIILFATEACKKIRIEKCRNVTVMYKVQVFVKNLSKLKITGNEPDWNGNDEVMLN